MNLLPLWIILSVFALLFLTVVLLFNGLIKKKLKVENNFSQIQIQCKKRYDLIPNLVECVKTFMSHEKETLSSVIKARNMTRSAENISQLAHADKTLSSTLGHLFALSENYPQLQANANFLQLQSELIGIENEISITRSFYNDTVMMYNKSVMSFPSSIVAKMFKFKKLEFFDCSEIEKQSVKVGF